MNKALSWIKKNSINILFFVFFILVFLSPTAKSYLIRGVASTGIPNSRIKSASENEPSVNFSVYDSEGKKQTISDFRGKVVFINVWASWCPPCIAEMPSIQNFYSQFMDNKDLVFLLINMDDDPLKGKEYMEKHNYLMPNYLPAENLPLEIYNGSLPTTVILDKNGKIRFHHTGAADYSKNGFQNGIKKLLNEPSS